jgi:hypothetical protein
MLRGLAIAAAVLVAACQSAPKEQDAGDAAGASASSADSASAAESAAPKSSANAQRRRTREGLPLTLRGSVKSMTEGAHPAGMDGKAYLLFSPAWCNRWIGADGAEVTIRPDDKGVLVLDARIASEQQFRDIQVHVEFRVPPPRSEALVARAEVLLHGAYGIVLTDSMNRPQRDDGCGAVQGQCAPEAPACFPPGTWQTMDIAFRAPRAATSGKPAQTARVTVMHNGVLVQNAVDIAPTEIDAASTQPERASLVLVPRTGAMELRNLWVRSPDAGLLPPKP